MLPGYISQEIFNDGYVKQVEIHIHYKTFISITYLIRIPALIF